ncbi:site-2 protease family protein [Pseudoalteromonas sp. SMS1]|uniref:site-2 protease family protein n=1 Tax=Pseudoalteromonas sp. SMS1 TaxID=2908894 RepID=UPI001F389261|nr:site-2 protease family protein [Pseudoalteromonas sp. SMS1]MCF2859185.1 site-2 protease family protein [Pseudoalteromonas sp. SMS1]
MYTFLISINVLVIIHTLCMVITARFFGVRVLEVSIGYGPKLLSYKGCVLKPFIFGGYVKMLDSRVYDLEESDLKYAFDHQKRFIRFLMPLSGCIGLILISLLILGESAFVQLYTGVSQIVLGGLKPMSIGSESVSQIVNFVSNNTLIMVFAFTSIKLAAFNLLPLPVSNGGQAILELLGLPEQVREVLGKLGSIILVVLLVSWIVAITSYRW